ncbi:MAG: hypothetical protein V4727_10530 [Verrucomicrobiota bacterium]
MKRWFLLLAIATRLCAQDLIAENVPEEITKSAVTAVQALGKEVVLGKYQVAIDKMYPHWKERAAKRMGGMDKLEKQLEDVSKEMLKRGISITDFKPQGQPRGFEVYPGKAVQIVDGKETEVMRYTKWLVLVPTVTRVRMLIKGDPVAVNYESTGFQVAICDKDSDEWYFIDGSGVTVSELRSLFITLPENLELPPLEKKQIK